MSNILVITPTPILPKTAGNRARIAALYDHLVAEGHCVSLAHVKRERGDEAKMTNQLGSSFYPIPYAQPRERGGRLRRVLQKLGCESAYLRNIDSWYDPGIEQPILEIIETQQIEVVIVEYAYMSKILERIPNSVAKIIDTHDVFANRHRRYLNSGVKPTWLSCTAASEINALHRADTVIAIQGGEAEYFKAHLTKPVVTVGHMVDISRRSYSCERPHSMLMVASNNSINLMSLKWFRDNVLGAVHAATGAKLIVAGSVCNELEVSADVEVLGQVEDLEPVFASASVVVNPMQLGTGLKIKSIEALGQKLPLVTTPIGAEGLEDGVGWAFRVATSAEDFASELIQILSDPALALELSSSAGEYAAGYNRQCVASLSRVLI